MFFELSTPNIFTNYIYMCKWNDRLGGCQWIDGQIGIKKLLKAMQQKFQARESHCCVMAVKVFNEFVLIALLHIYFFIEKINPGGLDSQDQLRSRLRTSIMSRLTFENCQDYPSRRDQFFLFRSRFLKLILFIRDLDVSRFLSKSLQLVQIIEINRDNHDFLR